MADTPQGEEPTTVVPPAPQEGPPPAAPYGSPQPPPPYGGPPPQYNGPPQGQWGPPPGQYGPPVGSGGAGLQPNVAAFLCYLFTWVTGLIFLLIEKENRMVKFHAYQAIGFGVAATVLWFIFIPLSFVPGLGLLITFIGYPVLGIGFLVLWIILMVNAYQGKMIKLPIIGDMAAQYAGI